MINAYGKAVPQKGAKNIHMGSLIMRRALFLIFIFIGACCFVCPTNAQSGSQFKDMREALDALRNATNPTDVDRIRAGLERVPVTSHQDLMALYDEARKQEDALPLIAKDKTYDDYGRHAAVLVSRVKMVTDPAFHDDIATLIDKEYQDTRREARLPMPKITIRSQLKAAMRYDRVNALITAAGDGKNAKARTALWEIIDIAQDDNLGKGAAIALGKIGNAEDIDRFITMLKQNPKLLFPIGAPIGGFGPTIIPRVIREVDDPGISKEAKARMAGIIGEFRSHEAIDMLQSLLSHSNPDVVRHAAGALEYAVRPGDDRVIREMLKNPAWNVRVCAIIAIGQQAWRDDYAQLLIDVLKNDPFYGNRVSAAYFLGEHHVQNAIPALRAASQGKVGGLRSEAANALKKIEGHK